MNNEALMYNSVSMISDVTCPRPVALGLCRQNKSSLTSILVRFLIKVPVFNTVYIWFLLKLNSY